MKIDRVFGIAAVAIVAGALVLAFLVIGTPGHARAVALDTRRVRDLQRLAYELHERYGNAGENLPASVPSDLVRRDPVTERPYVFRRLDRKRYTVCAVFATASERDESDAAFWEHPAGRKCYRFDVKHSAGLTPVVDIT